MRRTLSSPLLVSLTRLLPLALLTLQPAARAGDSGWWDAVEAQEKRDERIISRMVSELRPYVHQFSRDVYVYHWAGEGARGIPASDPRTRAEESKRYLRINLERGAKRDYTGDVMNGGLYVAPDPSSTSNYGRGSNPTLYQVVLPKGAVYIDARSWNNSLSDDLRKELAKRDCHVHKFEMIWKASTWANPGCRKFVLELYRILKPAAVAYSYTDNEAYGCRLSSTVAFILVDPSIADSEHWSAFAINTEPKETTKQEDFHRIKLQLNVAKDRFSYLFGAVRGKETEEQKAQIAAWNREHLFGCANYPEDRSDADVSIKNFSPYFLEHPEAFDSIGRHNHQYSPAARERILPAWAEIIGKETGVKIPIESMRAYRALKAPIVASCSEKRKNAGPDVLALLKPEPSPDEELLKRLEAVEECLLKYAAYGRDLAKKAWAIKTLKEAEGPCQILTDQTPEK